MADFDLSLVATFETQQAEAGATRVTGSIDKMAAAEKRAEATTRSSKGATDAAARAERERAAAIDAVRSAIEPEYAAQKRMNGLLAEAKNLYQQNAISLKQLEQVEKLHAQTMRGGAQSAGQARSAYTQLGFQIQDITQSLALGVNPMVVFGQQAGQTASAVSGMGGILGRVGTFLGGPWGALILGAVTVLGMLATSEDKAADKGKELGDGLNFAKMSADELIKATKELEAAQRKQIQSSYASEQAAIRDAEAALKAAIAKRDLARATLEAALASAQANAGQGTGGAAGAYASGQVDIARASLRELDANILTSQRLLREAQIPAAMREVEAATDSAAAATLRYDRAKKALDDQFASGKKTLEQYNAELLKLSRTRDADIERAQAQERAQRGANAEAAKAATYAAFDLPFDRSLITSGYGPRRRPTKGASSFHPALDFGVPVGTQVKAPQVGTVEAVGFDPGLGKFVVIDHGGGTRTTYGHLSDTSFVKKGDPIAKGQVIGLSGNTGISTGPHLDYRVTVNGKPVDPLKGRFPIDEVGIAEAAAKARESLEAFGNSASESIARITERFDEQPRMIDAAAQAARQLDDIIADLERRQPPGFEKMIADAREAKGVIADSLLRPFEDLERSSERRMTIAKLTAAGRDDEAEALQIIWNLEEKLGPIGAERRRQVLDMVKAEREVTEELEKRKELQSYYLEATRDVRQEIEAILSGTGKLSNLKTVFQQLKGKVLAEMLFGDIFRDLDKWVKQNSGIKDSVDILAGETERAGRSAGEFADSLDEAVAKIRGTSTGSSDMPADQWQEVLSEFDKVFGVGGSGGNPDGTSGQSDGEIVVTAMKGSVNGMTPERYFEEMTKRLVKPLLDGFDEIFGTQFFSKLEGVFSGAMNGYLTGGVPGGILGALKGIKGLPEGLSKVLDKGLKGAQTGTIVAGIGNALGIKMSNTGAQIGGMIGSVLPIPGGNIIGAIAGGLLGGLFSKAKYGTAVVSGGDTLTTTGRGDGRAAGAGTLGGAVQSGLKNIADALDAELGSFLVSIGTYKDDFRVSPSGKTGKLKGGDVVNFKKDEAGAIAFAIADAIADGAIKGISPAVERALKSSSDIEKATSEAVKVFDLEKRIRAMDDSFGAALDDFEKVAKQRVELAQKYGVDLLKVEALNAKERKALIEESLEKSVGSLRKLLDDLNTGSLFEGTAAERRARILEQIDKAKADSAAGVAGANDTLAELERQLVETSRQAFGTAGAEYAADRSQAISTAQSIIAAEEKRIEDAQAAQQQQLALTNETNDLLAGVNGRLDTLIGTFGLGGGYGGVSPSMGGISFGGSPSWREPVMPF